MGRGGDSKFIQKKQLSLGSVFNPAIQMTQQRVVMLETPRGGHRYI
jgi:hypothetical protein